MPRFRRTAVFAAVALGLLAGPAGASASFDAHIDGSRAIFDGTDAPEKLTITQNGDLFMHNDASAAYAGPFDFDSSQPGTQFFQVPAGQTRQIVVHGGGGDDVIQMSAPRANALLSGGAGNDTLKGSALRDILHGNDGADTLIANGAGDVLAGDAGNDTLRWKLTDGAAGLDGGADADTAELSGSDAGDQVALTPDVVGVRVAPSGGPGARIAAESIRLDTRAGDDTIDATNVPPAFALDLKGGSGDDSVKGGQGPDTVSGGDGHDIVRGGAGDDVLTGERALGDAGNDRMNVLPGDELAVGGVGADVLRLTMTAGDDDVSLRNDGGDGVRVDGLADGRPFGITAGDDEALAIELGDGDDQATVAPETGLITAVAISGDRGDDILHGSDGPETLLGAEGRDVLDGGLGRDHLLGGAGDDVIGARDGGQDVLACDTGADSVHADLGELDAIGDGDACELLDRAAATGVRQALAGVIAPGTLTADGQHRVNVPVTCSASARGGCHGTLTLTSSEPVAFAGALVPIDIGSAGFDIAPGTTVPVGITVRGGEGMFGILKAAGGPLPVQAEVLTGVAEGIPAARTTPIALNMLR